MNISVGDVTYRVRFSEQQLLLNREPVQAICDHRRKDVLVYAGLNAALMKQVMSECFTRIWAYWYGECECQTDSACCRSHEDQLSQSLDCQLD